MKLIKPTFEILPQSKGLDGIYKQIEIAGRTCYRSEDKITDTSAKEFVDRMIKYNHGAMLEQGTVYLTHLIENSGSPSYLGIGTKYRENKYSKVNYSNWGVRYITTNYRVLVENDWLDDLQYLCEPTEFHAKRTTVKFIMDRIGSQSFVRHRVFSFAQESTRYCNYSKDKFDNEITFIEPLWLEDDYYKEIYLSSLKHAESAYLDLLKQWDRKIEDKRFKSGYKNNPWTAQQARGVLPNSLKTELVMTGFDSDWEHFFKLRTVSTAHPQARELAIPLHKEFIKLNKIKLCQRK